MKTYDSQDSRLNSFNNKFSFHGSSLLVAVSNKFKETNSMDTIAVLLMLGLMIVAFVAASYAMITWVNRDSNVKNQYRWRISSGICYTLLAANGAFALGYLTENRLTTSLVVVGLLLVGILLMSWGFKIRDLVLKETGNKSK